MCLRGEVDHSELSGESEVASQVVSGSADGAEEEVPYAEPVGTEEPEHEAEVQRTEEILVALPEEGQGQASQKRF